MAGPIKPADVTRAKRETFPDAAFEAFNELITQMWVNDSAVVKQADVVELMIKKGLDRNEIDNQGWLNVEDAYRAVGWSVDYDKPGFNEDYPATFTFKKKKGRSLTHSP